MRIVASGATATGQVREINEDSFLVDDRQRLFAVADGMGGHQAGEIASATAVEALRAAVASGQPVNDAIRAANRAVFEKAAADRDLEGMGTTITAIVAPASGDTLLIGHVGDSRAYLLRDDDLTRLTEDHSLVEELVREGRLTVEQAEVHPQRAIITRALGVEEDVEVDVYTVNVRAGDRIVLCSDGLTTMVRERDVEQIARAGHDARRTAQDLVAAADEAGGEDNITVVVLDVAEVDEAAPPDPEALAAADAPATPEPVAPPDAPAPPPTTQMDAPLPRRRRAFGLLILLVPLLVVVAVAIGGLYYYARGSYYVGLDGDEVVLYRGLPGGVLGWDPTVEARTAVYAGELADSDREDLADDGAGRGSRARAERYLAALLARTTTTTTTTSSTTTTSTTTPVTTSARAGSNPS